jgi:hypothetical protein
VNCDLKIISYNYIPSLGLLANSVYPSSVWAQINEVLVKYQLNTARLEKLTVVQLVKKFPAVYETRMYIIVFTRAQHWFLL